MIIQHRFFSNRNKPYAPMVNIGASGTIVQYCTFLGFGFGQPKKRYEVKYTIKDLILSDGKWLGGKA